ncbi:CHAT domain-containing protein [Kibdelosporangium aridum]|uniref:CHAT domain-containing protein n=1 Tax=Kibdelosporangium aridum TaxID=2030 RepID=UPI00056A0113|nr:CHAT domain-containing protein [Kibdelosporangium aridum]
MSTDAGTPLEAVCAAIGAGEPRRAARLLDQLDPSAKDDVGALRHCVSHLDVQWWPGEIGAGVDLMPTAESSPPDSLLGFFAHEVLPLSLALRTLASGARRAGEQAGHEMLSNVLSPRIAQWQRFASQSGDTVAMAWVELLRVDVERRAGRPESTFALMNHVRDQPQDADPLTVALVHLIAGDALLTPLQSPETCGFDLAARSQQAVLGDAAARTEAEGLYRVARAAFQTAQAPRGVAAVDLRLGWLCRLDGRPDTAQEMITAAAEGFHQAGDDAGHILAVTHLAVADLMAGRLSPTRPGPVAQVSGWATGDGSRSYALGCAGIVHCCGNALRDQGDIEAALAAFDLSRRLHAALGDRFGEQAVIGDLAELYARLNTRGATITTLEEAIAEQTAATGDLDTVAWLNTIHLLVWLGNELLKERDPDGLARLRDRAARLLARAPGGPRELAGPDEDLLVRQEKAQRRLARLGAARGGPHAGGEDWASMTADNIEIAVSAMSDIVVTADVMAHQCRALAAAQRGEVALAEREFTAALAAAEPVSQSLVLAVLAGWGRKADLPARTAMFLDSMPDIDPEHAATLWFNAGEFERASNACGTTPPESSTVDWSRTWDGLTLRARIALGLGRADEAAAYAAEAAARFEQWFAAVASDAFRVAVLDDASVRRIYQAAASAALLSDDPGSAFAAADRARSFSLGALVADAEWATSVPAFRAWRQAEAEWVGRFDRRRAAWRRSATGMDPRTASDLAEAQTRLDAAASEVERQSPGVARSRPTALPPATAEDVGAHLPPDALLIEYLFGDDHLVICALTESRCQGWRLDTDSLALTGIIHRLHTSWQTGSADVTADEQSIADTLLGPVRHLLDDHDRLIFVPSGVMHLLPFHALPYGGRPLGHDRAISQLPAAALIPRLAGRPAPRLDGGAVVVGNPATHPSRGLRRLPGAEVEALTLARLLKTKALIGEHANEAALRTALTEGSPILHMATHGVLDDEAPTLSSLVLAGHDEITLAELLGIGLDVDLAVLSACDTGRGDITMSGDVVGLARGLLAAGVRHSVVSQWPVDDEVGCLTMAAFADRIARGHPVAWALAQAQQQVRLTSAPDRRDWYADLAQQVNAPVTSGGSRSARDVRPPGAHRRRATHPSWWAPFIHIGL